MADMDVFPNDDVPNNDEISTAVDSIVANEETAETTDASNEAGEEETLPDSGSSITHDASRPVTDDEHSKSTIDVKLIAKDVQGAVALNEEELLTQVVTDQAKVKVTVPHPSIVAGLDDFLAVKCIKSGCNCGLFHCHICPLRYFKPTSRHHQTVHINIHLKHSLKYKDWHLCICKLPCQPRAHGKASHFHCPDCGKTIAKKERMLAHLQSHMKSIDGSTEEEQVQVPTKRRYKTRAKNSQSEFKVQKPKRQHELVASPPQTRLLPKRRRVAPRKYLDAVNSDKIKELDLDERKEKEEKKEEEEIESPATEENEIFVSVAAVLSTKQLNSISKSRETILQELEEGAGVTHVFSENNCVLHGKHKAINKAHKILLKMKRECIKNKSNLVYHQNRRFNSQKKVKVPTSESDSKENLEQGFVEKTPLIATMTESGESETKTQAPCDIEDVSRIDAENQIECDAGHQKESDVVPEEETKAKDIGTENQLIDAGQNQSTEKENLSAAQHTGKNSSESENEKSTSGNFIGNTGDIQNESADDSTTENIRETTNTSNVKLKPKISSEKSKPFNCSRCKYSSASKMLLKKHIQRCYGIKSHVCTVCGRGFSIVAELRVHLRRHKWEEQMAREEEGAENNQSDSTTERTAILESVNSQIAKLDSGGKKKDKDVQCDECGNIFTNMSSLFLHKKRHLRGEVKDLYKCEHCDYQNKDQFLFEQHVARKHGERPHLCTICNKTYALERDLTLHHKVAHTEDSAKMCQICGKSFRAQRYLTSHIQRLHQKVKRHFCSVCNKGFFELIKMKDHMATHQPDNERIRPHKCSHCPKAFINKTYLRDHLNTHTGERPHVCSVCNKSFAMYVGLKKHMIYHSTEKPYQCQTCDKAFKVKAKLKAHMITHTGISKFKCEVCSKVFTSNTTLRGHVLRHRCRERSNSITTDTIATTTINIPRSDGLVAPGSAVTKVYLASDDADLSAVENALLATEGTVIETATIEEVNILQLSEGGVGVEGVSVEKDGDVGEEGVSLQQPVVEFYMCSVCNTMFQDFDEIQQHVLSHN